MDLVDHIRRIALALPEATEELTWDDINFRVRKKIFCFPAATGMSNVTFVVDDDVDVASGTSLVTPLDGFAIYASGRVHMAAQRTMSACAADDYLSPFGQVIRIVMPPKPPAT